MSERRLSVAEIEALTRRVLLSAGASDAAALALARAVASAEACGLSAHGLAYVPTYCEHLRCGKVDGQALPQLSQPKPALLVVDAGTGFAHPAIDLGFERLVPLARITGIAALAVRNSYNCGVLGYHVERLAGGGLLALGFTNAPASIAPSGGLKPVVGTNPFALAVPDGKGAIALSIDQSASVVAKSEIMRRQREGQAIPAGWAYGPDGQPTEDPAVALQGTMAPAGGYKGVSIALLVELLAAAAAGATLGRFASPFSGPSGGPPRTGQFFIAIDPYASSGGSFDRKVADLVGCFALEPGAQLPGKKRAEARKNAERDGILVNRSLLERLKP